MSINNIENQEQLLKDYPEPIDIKGTYKILEQMENSVCLIYKVKGGKASGFFCNIFYENYKIPVLITNYHVINENYIKENKMITLTTNDENYRININLEGNRNYYSNEDYDTTIIELNPKNDKIYYFLELDPKIFDDCSNTYYENESLYLMQYPNQKLSVSYGIMKEILDFDINHCCSTQDGSSGSPILLLKNKKVIGIHKEKKTFYNFNKGTFLKKPILEFLEILRKNNQLNKYYYSMEEYSENNNNSNISKIDNISGDSSPKESEIEINYNISGFMTTLGDASKNDKNTLKNISKIETSEDTKITKNNKHSTSNSKNKYSQKTIINGNEVSDSTNLNIINNKPIHGLVCLSNK